MTATGVREIVALVLSVLLIAWLLRQCRKPSGLLGRVLLWAWNRSHSTLTDWALTHIPLRKNDAILDVGCGGGRTVRRLSALAPEGTVWGIDPSGASVAASRRTNAPGIGTGRVHIQLGSVGALPFPDRTFDVVTAVETHYWPDLPTNMREILRVLKPGGTVALIAETYRGRRFDGAYSVVMRLIRAAYLSIPEHRDLLTQAGFSEVSTVQAPKRSWICAMGRRPSSPLGE